MIICTKGCDVYLRKFGNKVAISKMQDSILDLRISPNIHNKQLFVFASDDFKNKRAIENFKVALEGKHSEVKVIYIDKKGKGDAIGSLAGIDKVLLKPKPDNVVDAVTKMLEDISEKKVTESSYDSVPVVEEYKPIDNEEEYPERDIVEVQAASTQDITDEESTLFVPNMDSAFTVVKPEKPKEVAVEKSFVERIKDTDSTVDMKLMTQELKLARVLKDVTKENHEYKSIVDRLKVLQNDIEASMLDVTLPIEKRFDNVRALMLDRQTYMTKTASIIEEVVNNIVLSFTETTNKIVRGRLEELDRRIENLAKREAFSTARLSGILDERNSILIELAVLDRESRELFYSVDNFAMEASTSISENGTDLTGSPLLNAQLRAKGINTVSQESLSSIISMLTTLDSSNSKFKELITDIKVINTKLYKVLELDREIIEAQQEVIKWLHANQIEDTVVANTLLKKCVRVFTGTKGSGVTANALMLSYLKSRTSSNVLLLDLRKRPSKYDEYAQEYVTLDEFLNTPVYKHMQVVCSQQNTEYTEGFVNKLEVELMKAADYYRVINLVIDPEDMDALSPIVSQALTINYIVHPDIDSFDAMTKCLVDTKQDNVARRVIINKTDETALVLKKLNLTDCIDVGVMTVPYIPQVPNCSLTKVNICSIPTICSIFEEVSMYA